MALKHLILGCLMEQPSYGYEMLTALYKDFLDLGPGVNDGQLYSSLSKMESEGLIKKEVVHQEKAPSKKIIHITEKGRTEFLDWMFSDDGENETVRFDFFSKYEFLNKCNFFNHLDKGKSIEKIFNQINIAEEKLKSLQRARASMERKGVLPFRIKILDYGIKVQKVRIEWLKEAADLFREEAKGND